MLSRSPLTFAFRAASLCLFSVCSAHIRPRIDVLTSPSAFLFPYTTHTDPNEFTAVVGGHVALPCNTTPPAPDDGVVLIFWYQETIANPIYTIDARTTQLSKAKHFAHHSYENRVQFNVTDPISYFRIKPVKESDGGHYRCRVSAIKHRTACRHMKYLTSPPLRSRRSTSSTAEL